VGSVLLTGATFAAATELAPTTVPMVLVGWVAAIGLPFALPLVVVVGVVAALERRQ
jgi:S1-C subfamily serine protease